MGFALLMKTRFSPDVDRLGNSAVLAANNLSTRYDPRASHKTTLTAFRVSSCPFVERILVSIWPGEQGTTESFLRDTLLVPTVKQKRHETRWTRVSARLCAIIGLLLVANAAYASRCEQLKAQPNAWVATRVDALVLSARRAYESDEALSAYERVLDGITGTMPAMQRL